MGTLFARVTVNGKRSEISLKREIENDKWDTSAGKVKGNSPASKSLNQHLNEVKTQLFDIYQELHSKKEFISTEVIKKKFLGEEKIEHTLVSFIQLHNDDLKKRSVLMSLKQLG